METWSQQDPNASGDSHSHIHGYTSTLQQLMDSGGRRLFLEKNKLAILLYTCLLAFVLFVYHVLSDGDFSFLLTLGAIVNLFGFLFIVSGISSSNAATRQGLSLKTLECYVLVYTCRLCSILFYEGYLPFDRSGDWLYQTVEVLSLLLTFYLVMSIGLDKYNIEHDSFANALLTGKLGINNGGYIAVLILIIPCIFLALIFHPSLNRNKFTDTAWTFAAYLEVVAILPQFYILQKSNKEVDGYVAQWIFNLGLSRVFMFVFWLSSFHELADKRAKFVLAGYEGYLILFVQILHLLIMAEFCVYYILAARRQQPLIIPSAAPAIDV